MSWFIVIPGLWEEGTVSFNRLWQAKAGVRLVRAETPEKVAERFYDHALVIPVHVYPADRDSAASP